MSKVLPVEMNGEELTQKNTFSETLQSEKIYIHRSEAELPKTCDTNMNDYDEQLKRRN